MMNKLSLFFISICLFSTVFTSCNTNSIKKENDITFDSIQVAQKYHMLNQENNPNCDLNFKFIYPIKLENQAILKELQHQFVYVFFGDDYIKYTPQEAAKLYTHNYIEQYKEMEEDFKKESKDKESPVHAWYSYYEFTSNEIVYNKNNILSNCTSFENYTGGAHGSHSLINTSFDLRTGKAITEKDIFVDNFEEDLAKILVGKIAQQFKVEKTEELENIGFFSIDEIYPNGNFLISEDGIQYTFNEYEIAAYVVGAIQVLLPYGEISFLLKPESPISEIIQE